MKDKKAAKVLIQRAKLNPDLYSSADILYAKKIRKKSKKMKKKDSLKINQNKDGSYTAEWDKQDPEWSWMNNLTSKEVIEKAVKLEAKEDDEVSFV